MTNYLVKFAIWHTGEDRHYDAGAVVTLPHLDEETIARLVELGVVEPTTLDVTPGPGAPAEED